MTTQSDSNSVIFFLLCLLSGAGAVSVFVSTLNTDALFETSKPKDATALGVIQRLAGRMAEQFVASRVSREEPIFLFHFQEIISCASGVNGFKMGMVQRTSEVDFARFEPKGKNQVELNLHFFVESLVAAVKDQAGEDIQCPKGFLCQAIGTVVCLRVKDVPHYSLLLLKKTQFGESFDNGLLGTDFLKFGYKGAIVIKVRNVLNLDRPDVVSVNVHLSSRSLPARRRQFLKVLRRTLKQEESLAQKRKQLIRSAVFFFAGDFNARTGSNVAGVTDKNFMKPANELYFAVLPCFQKLAGAATATPDLNAAYELALEDTKALHSAAMTCGKAVEFLGFFDEYRTWFDQNESVVQAMADCAEKKPKEGVFPRGDRPFYSPIFEGDVDFLPTFCFSKRAGTYGCEKEKELISYTDRVMWALRATEADIAAKNVWDVAAKYYAAHALDTVSDHAGVFAGFELASQARLPSWLARKSLQRVANGPNVPSQVCDQEIQNQGAINFMRKEYLARHGLIPQKVLTPEEKDRLNDSVDTVDSDGEGNRTMHDLLEEEEGGEGGIFYY